MKQSKPQFTIDGKPPGYVSASKTRLRAYIEAMPFGTMLTSRKLAEEVQCNYHFLIRYSAEPEMSDVRVKDGARMLFGSPKTIAAWKEAKGIP